MTLSCIVQMLNRRARERCDRALLVCGALFLDVWLSVGLCFVSSLLDGVSDGVCGVLFQDSV